MSGAGGARWWRRNWWGLAAVVPLLAAVVVVSPSGAFQALRDHVAGNEEELIHPGADGWASYGDARLRLTGFGPTELFTDDQQPLPIPGLTAWQVTVTVETGDDPDALLGCEFQLEDVAGRRYVDSPDALDFARNADGRSVSSVGCSRRYDDFGNGPFEAVGYILMPDSIEPVALRVTHFALEPAYVLLDVG